MANLTHRHARTLVQGALDRPLAAKEQARLDAHLVACSACRRYADQVRGLEDDLRRAMKQRWDGRTGNLSPGAIQARSRRFRMQKTTWNMAKVLGGVALVIALFFVANTLLQQPEIANPSPTGGAQQAVTSGEPLGSIAWLIDPATLCAATSAEPLVGTGEFTWPVSNPHLSVRDSSEIHTGLDFAAAEGDAILAADSGVAVFAHWNSAGYGNMVILDHRNGWYSLYTHLERIDVDCGQNVQQGAVIGTSGYIENTTEPVHFSIVNHDQYANPWEHLPPVGPSTMAETQYEVQENDTCASIAAAFGIPVDVLMDANDLRAPCVVYLRQILFIPQTFRGPGGTIDGEWTADTEFGRLIFTVDRTGTSVTRMRFQFGDWTCGSTTHSGEIVDASRWQILYTDFAAYSTFDQNGTVTMSVKGTYDAASQRFTGTWEEYSGSTRCAGDWEASMATAANADPAGEWAATTDFGRFFFTVDSTGTWITRTRLEFNPGWMCGSETDFDSIVISGHQRIPDDENTAFGWTWPVDDSSTVHISVVWAPNAISKIFFGRWEVVAGTVTCEGDWEATSSNGASEYEVQAGDTCASIAEAFNIPASRIILENDLAADCSDLFVGQTLVIPPPVTYP